MEIKILDMIQNLHTTVGDHFFIGITKLGDAGIIWIFLTILLLILPKMRKYGLAMLVGLCIDVIVCNGLLKNLVARTRPCDVNTAIQLLISHPTDYSFPSGHTAASFTAVAALYFSGDKKIWKAAIVLGTLIAFSRMYLYVHYPTDVQDSDDFQQLMDEYQSIKQYLTEKLYNEKKENEADYLILLYL